jgi:hypothetical protein
MWADTQACRHEKASRHYRNFANMPKKDPYVQTRPITYAPAKFPDLQQQYQQLLV